jgi:dihydrofolate reductase
LVGSGRTRRRPPHATFIVSHSEPEHVPEDGVYTFVDDPLKALELARAAAAEKDIDVFSPNIAQQLLRAGRVDEIRVHVVPVLFGAGTRLFEDGDAGQIQLEITGVVEGEKATHLSYAVLASA